MEKPNLWQLRLGERGQKKQDWREVFLADKYSLISIDYGIQRDITNMNTYQEIEDYIREINDGSELKIKEPSKFEWIIKKYSEQVYNFKNDIKEGDYVISPINYLEAPSDAPKGLAGNARIGQIVGKMGTLESLFEGNLAPHLPNTAYSFNLKRCLKIDECRNLPTHKVKWLTRIFPESKLDDEIIPKTDTGDRKGAVARLTFSKEMPYGLAPEAVFLKHPMHRKIKKIIKSWLTLPRVAMIFGILAAIATIAGLVLKLLGYI